MPGHSTRVVHELHTFRNSDPHVHPNKSRECHVYYSLRFRVVKPTLNSITRAQTSSLPTGALHTVGTEHDPDSHKTLCTVLYRRNITNTTRGEGPNNLSASLRFSLCMCRVCRLQPCFWLRVEICHDERQDEKATALASLHQRRGSHFCNITTNADARCRNLRYRFGNWQTRWRH
jgi:hypothetical protein